MLGRFRGSGMTFLLLVGCELFGGSGASGGWINQAPGCEIEPYAWSDDLVSYLLAGEGDGGFSFDPSDTPRSEIAGQYDVTSGEFAYEIAYDEDYFIVAAAVNSGFGTAWHNGDLDVEYSYSVEDKLGNKAEYGLRVERVGCRETRWSWNPDDDEPTYVELGGEYGEDGFSWEQEAEDATYTGVLEPDGTQREEYEADDGSVEESYVTHPDGTRDREFRTESKPYVYQGDALRHFDGNQDLSYEITQNGDKICSVEAEYQYDGDGDERWECGDDSFDCEIDVDENGKCTYACDNGESGRC
jgi:hypothetical protein